MPMSSGELVKTGRGAAGRPYVSRKPEQTVLHRVVREHLETFLAEARLRGGGEGVPAFVERGLQPEMSKACGNAALLCCAGDSVLACSLIQDGSARQRLVDVNREECPERRLTLQGTATERVAGQTDGDQRAEAVAQDDLGAAGEEAEIDRADIGKPEARTRRLLRWCDHTIGIVGIDQSVTVVVQAVIADLSQRVTVIEMSRHCGLTHGDELRMGRIARWQVADLDFPRDGWTARCEEHTHHECQHDLS